MIIRLFLTISMFFALSICNSLVAEQAQEEDPDKGLPKGGVLSNSVSDSGGYNSKIAIPWNKEGSAPDKEAPISGSVFRSNEKQWKARVYNNTEDSFSIDTRIKQINKSGGVVKSDSFSARLKPKQSIERLISANASAVDAQLELVSWKRISSKPAEPQEAELTESLVQAPSEESVDTRSTPKKMRGKQEEE